MLLCGCCAQPLWPWRWPWELQTYQKILEQEPVASLSPASSALSQWQEMDHSYLNQSGQAWRVTGGLIQLEGECYRREIRRKKHWGLIIDSLFTQNLVHFSGQEVEEREADIPRPHQTHKLSPRPSVKDALSSQFISYPGRLRQFKYATVNHLIVSELGFTVMGFRIGPSLGSNGPGIKLFG